MNPKLGQTWKRNGQYSDRRVYIQQVSKDKVMFATCFENGKEVTDARSATLSLSDFLKYYYFYEE